MEMKCFHLLIRPTTTGLADASRIAQTFEREVAIRLSGVNLSTSLAAIVVFPRLLPVGTPLFSDSVKHKRRDNCYYVHLGMHYERWLSEAEENKIDLFSSCIKEAIARVPDKKFSAVDREIVFHILESILKEMRASQVRSL